MNLGLDIGRQFVKAVLLEKNRGGTKIVNTGIRLVPDQNKSYDPELITKPMWVMAVRELMREMNINPKRVKNLVTSLNGTNVSVKQITTMDMPEDELFSSMTFEARKHIPMDGSDAVIDFQVFGPNPKEVDKIDIGLVACTKKVSNAHIELLKEIGFTPGIVDAEIGPYQLDLTAGGCCTRGSYRKVDCVNALILRNEFVLSRRAVRGLGKGSYELGAKILYQLMAQWEREANKYAQRR